MENLKKSVFTSIFGSPEDREFVEKEEEKKKRVWRPIARAKRYCLLPDTFWLRAFKNAFKAGTVNLANSLSPPFIEKKVHTVSKKTAKGLKQCRVKVKGVNNPAWTAQ